MFIRSVVLVVALLFVGCTVGLDYNSACIKAQAAIEVYEECMATPSCKMNSDDRSEYIFYKTNYRKYKCETRLSNPD